MITNETDGYDAADNAYKCWQLAIECARHDLIRSGKAAPRLDNVREMEVAREAGFQIVQASTHRRSA